MPMPFKSFHPLKRNYSSLNAVKNTVRAVISLGLLGYLIYIADPQKIADVFSNIWHDGGFLFVIIASFVFIFALSLFALRWQVLVKGYNLIIPTTDLFKFYLIGLFFNNFLPTAIGGDVIRIYHFIKKSGERTLGFASVMTERLFGITGTLLLTLGSLLFLLDELQSPLILVIAVSLLLIIIMFILLIFNDRFMTWLVKVMSLVKILRLGERIIKFLDAVRFFRNTKRVFVKILIYSIVAQSLVIIMTYFLARSLNMQVSFAYIFLVVPVTFLLTMLPSINGIGFREGGFVILLGKVGISKAAAISLSFLAILIPMIISVWGGILFLMQKNIPGKEALNGVSKN
jgi:uncharacterized protein (TIRG00374 family)